MKAYKELQKLNKFKFVEKNFQGTVWNATSEFYPNELLVFVDSGNLCFGGRIIGVKDYNEKLKPGNYTVEIYID